MEFLYITSIYFILAIFFRFILPIFGSLNFISSEFYRSIILVNDYFSRKQYLFWVLFFPFSLWLVSIVFYLLDFSLLVKNIWLVAVLFWIILYVDIIFFLKRGLLLSRKNFITIALLSILVTLFFDKQFYNNGLESLLPQESFWFWAILFAFIISLFWYGHKTITDDSNERIECYIHTNIKKFEKDYASILEGLSISQKKLLLAILVVENYNRPKSVRIFEKLFSYIGLAKTTGIAQISQKGLSDFDSVKLLKKKVQQEYKEVEFDLDNVRNFLKNYNGNHYDEIVLAVLQIIDSKFIKI